MSLTKISIKLLKDGHLTLGRYGNIKEHTLSIHHNISPIEINRWDKFFPRVYEVEQKDHVDEYGNHDTYPLSEYDPYRIYQKRKYEYGYLFRPMDNTIPKAVVTIFGIKRHYVWTDHLWFSYYHYGRFVSPFSSILPLDNINDFNIIWDIFYNDSGNIPYEIINYLSNNTENDYRMAINGGTGSSNDFPTLKIILLNYLRESKLDILMIEDEV